MIVAKSMSKYKTDKNRAYAMKGILEKQFPNLKCEVIVKEGKNEFGDEDTYGIEFSDGTRIYADKRDFNYKIKRYLMLNGITKTFLQTVKDYIKFLDTKSDWDDLDMVSVCSFRYIKETNDCEMYHRIIHDEAVRNCPYKWMPRETFTMSEDRMKFFKANSHIWGIPCEVGFDPFQESYVSIRKSDVPEFKNLLMKMFIELTK